MVVDITDPVAWLVSSLDTVSEVPTALVPMVELEVLTAMFVASSVVVALTPLAVEAPVAWLVSNPVSDVTLIAVAVIDDVRMLFDVGTAVPWLVVSEEACVDSPWSVELTLVTVIVSVTPVAADIILDVTVILVAELDWKATVDMPVGSPVASEKLCVDSPGVVKLTSLPVIVSVTPVAVDIISEVTLMSVAVLDCEASVDMPVCPPVASEKPCVDCPGVVKLTSLAVLVSPDVILSVAWVLVDIISEVTLMPVAALDCEAAVDTLVCWPVVSEGPCDDRSWVVKLTSVTVMVGPDVKVSVTPVAVDIISDVIPILVAEPDWKAVVDMSVCWPVVSEGPCVDGPWVIKLTVLAVMVISDVTPSVAWVPVDTIPEVTLMLVVALDCEAAVDTLVCWPVVSELPCVDCPWTVELIPVSAVVCPDATLPVVWIPVDIVSDVTPMFVTVLDCEASVDIPVCCPVVSEEPCVDGPWVIKLTVLAVMVISDVTPSVAWVLVDPSSEVTLMLVAALDWEAAVDMPVDWPVISEEPCVDSPWSVELTLVTVIVCPDIVSDVVRIFVTVLGCETSIDTYVSWPAVSELLCVDCSWVVKLTSVTVIVCPDIVSDVAPTFVTVLGCETSVDAYVCWPVVSEGPCVDCSWLVKLIPVTVIVCPGIVSDVSPMFVTVLEREASVDMPVCWPVVSEEPSVDCSWTVELMLVTVMVCSDVTPPVAWVPVGIISEVAPMLVTVLARETSVDRYVCWPVVSEVPCVDEYSSVAPAVVPVIDDNETPLDVVKVASWLKVSEEPCVDCPWVVKLIPVIAVVCSAVTSMFVALLDWEVAVYVPVCEVPCDDCILVDVCSDVISAVGSVIVDDETLVDVVKAVSEKACVECCWVIELILVTVMVAADVIACVTWVPVDIISEVILPLVTVLDNELSVDKTVVTDIVWTDPEGVESIADVPDDEVSVDIDVVDIGILVPWLIVSEVLCVKSIWVVELTGVNVDVCSDAVEIVVPKLVLNSDVTPVTAVDCDWVVEVMVSTDELTSLVAVISVLNVLVEELVSIVDAIVLTDSSLDSVAVAVAVTSESVIVLTELSAIVEIDSSVAVVTVDDEIVVTTVVVVRIGFINVSIGKSWIKIKIILDRLPLTKTVRSTAICTVSNR